MSEEREKGSLTLSLTFDLDTSQVAAGLAELEFDEIRDFLLQFYGSMVKEKDGVVTGPVRNLVDAFLRKLISLKEDADLIHSAMSSNVSDGSIN